MGMELDSEIRRLYPFQSRFLETGGHRLHYVDEGKGEPLLLLHGNPTWSFYYRNLIREFSPSFRCVAPDHIGCGLSDKPPDYPYRLSQHIDNLEALADHLGLEDITLAVHDWGGAIGFGLAARRPGRIKRLILFNTAAFRSTRIPFRINICRLPGFGALAIRGANAFAGAAVRMATTRPGGLPPEVRRGFLWPYRSWRDRVATLRFVQDIPLNPSHPSWETLVDIEKALPTFRDRLALICWGGRDFCFNDSFLERWKTKLPGARVCRYAEAGHYVVEDALPEIVAEMRAFLD